MLCHNKTVIVMKQYTAECKFSKGYTSDRIVTLGT